MKEVAQQAHSQAIDQGTTLGLLTLRVADAARSTRFYKEVLGFQETGQVQGMPLLGAARAPILLLKETPGAVPGRRFSGLYHFAVLVPTRAALGRSLRRLAEARVQIGQADHLVSEALYLSDPDDNGIEIYRDRPRSEWKWSKGMVEMATDPLDLDDLLREEDAAADQSPGLPAGTRIGHVHLQVSDVEQAVRFYHEVLGFDVTAAWHGAAFLSAGGYHHHLGLNSWSSRGAPPAPPDSPGLESFVIQVPRAEEQARLEAKLREAGIPSTSEGGVLHARDPWNIEVRIEIEDGRQK